MPSHSTNITRKSVVCGGHTEQPPELNSHHSQHVVSVLVTGLVTVLVTEEERAAQSRLRLEIIVD